MPLLHAVTSLLPADGPLPTDRPFTTRQAGDWGVSRDVLARLVREGLVRRLLHGVYVAAQVPDSLSLRVHALRLVAPPGAVAVDWTAYWVHTGLLPFNDHLHVPPVSLFLPSGGTRIRREGCLSGERELLPEDLVEVEGMSISSPLRTAWDLGRLVHRDSAIGALDALLRSGHFTHEELLAGVERFARRRGVVQLRQLAPLADPRAESPAESVMRLRWHDTPGLPAPRPQIPVFDERGVEVFRIDLGVDELRFGAEYYGRRWHGPEAGKQVERYDEQRLAWLEAHGWTMRVLRRDDVFGARADAGAILLDGVREARRRLGRFRPTG